MNFLSRPVDRFGFLLQSTKRLGIFQKVMLCDIGALKSIPVFGYRSLVNTVKLDFFKLISLHYEVDAAKFMSTVYAACKQLHDIRQNQSRACTARALNQIPTWGRRTR